MSAIVQNPVMDIALRGSNHNFNKSCNEGEKCSNCIVCMWKNVKSDDIFIFVHVWEPQRFDHNCTTKERTVQTYTC